MTAGSSTPYRSRPKGISRVLKEIEGLMQAKRKGDWLDLLVTLLEAWERKRYPLDLPDAINS